jgi:hypothetical protein
MELNNLPLSPKRVPLMLHDQRQDRVLRTRCDFAAFMSRVMAALMSPCAVPKSATTCHNLTLEDKTRAGLPGKQGSIGSFVVLPGVFPCARFGTTKGGPGGTHKSLAWHRVEHTSEAEEVLQLGVDCHPPLELIPSRQASSRQASWSHSTLAQEAAMFRRRSLFAVRFSSPAGRCRGSRHQSS